MEIKKSIREFILESYLFTDDESALKDEQSLLEAGIIDSTGILELIEFIQSSFGVEVEDDEMVPDNFDSVDSIVAYITRKTTG